MPGEFEPEQKRYLEGLMTGLQIAKTLRPASGNGTAPVASTGPNGAAASAPEPIGPDDEALCAQDRAIKAGGKLFRSGEIQARTASVRRLRAAE